MSCCRYNYRFLCAYDDLHNDCNPPPLGQMSYACEGSGDNSMCVFKHSAPGPGSYSNLQECQRQCRSPLGQFSYACEGLGDKNMCVFKHSAPGPGSYSNLQECQAHCSSGGGGSFKCLSVGPGSGGSHRMCVHSDSPLVPGSFSTMKECQAMCRN